MSRIAIFRALYLGDMLCIIPSVRAVRKAHPCAEIFLVGLPWQKDFVARFPWYFDKFIEFPGWPGLPEQPVDGEKIVQFLQTIRTYRFDLVLQMHGNGVLTNGLCMLWGAKKVCGLRHEGGYPPGDECFPVSEDGEHEILRFFKILDRLAIPHQGSHLEFPVSDAEVATFKQIISRSGIVPRQYVCIHPGARDIRRRWPAENFAYIANQIAIQGYKLVLTGSMDEKDLLKSLEEKIHSPVLNIVETFGHLTAGELAVVLKHARLLISNDTGVSHIAAALEVPSVILFSPHSDINRWRPLQSEKHTAVSADKGKDVDHVLECVLAKLDAADDRKD